MWLMKTLLTSRCINQRGAGHDLEDLTNALHGAMQDANSRKWGLSEEQANELYELWLHFREQLPSDWVPK